MTENTGTTAVDALTHERADYTESLSLADLVQRADDPTTNGYIYTGPRWTFVVK